MTESANEQQEYWYIQVPKNKFPFPKFHLGQRVKSYWTDEYGQTQYDIAEIIGMLYGASGYKCDEWYYLLRILESETSPKLVGSNDRAFHKESSLGADDTDIEQG